MKQKLFLFLFLILIVVTLIGLNAATYVQKEKAPDSEWDPNRSTYNSGSTGTQALYALLSETGRKVVRWQDPPSALHTVKKTPAVFVMIGRLRRDTTEDESEAILRWVANGGRLVLIDREPPKDLITTTANWEIKFDGTNPVKLVSSDPSDPNQMIADTLAIKPVQPTVFAAGVNAIHPSRLAASVRFEQFENSGDKQSVQEYQHETAPPPPKKLEKKPDPSKEEYEKQYDFFSPEPSAEKTPFRQQPLEQTTDKEPPSSIRKVETETGTTRNYEEEEDTDLSIGSAPMVHFAAGSKNLLVEAPYGDGKIVYLADPFIVSNGGISLVDNAQLAINILSAGASPIAFDEYHQGYGANSNKFLEFFAGTPVVAIFLQFVLLAGFLFFSQSRRFARPVPEAEPDRLSKLEYVSAMAELQERSQAFDLAIENIYNEFRRRATRLLGADNFSVKYDDLAKLIAERTGLDQTSVADTLFKCEEIIRGEPTNKSEIVGLTGEMRRLEEKLGLTPYRKSSISR